MLSPLLILILAFVAARYVFLGVMLYGVVITLTAGIVLAEALARGRFMSRGGGITRVDRPRSFWGLVGLQVLVLVIGLGLTQVWILHQ
jgi:hypothetical protein